KTGYEIRAGRCLAASATRNGRQLIVVVLNSGQIVADAATLMDFGFSLSVVQETAAAAPGYEGRFARLLTTAATIAPRGEERSRLRSLLRGDELELERDPAALAGPNGIFERLAERST